MKRIFICKSLSNYKAIALLSVIAFCFATSSLFANQEIKVTCSSRNGAECQIETKNQKVLDVFELSSPRRLVIDVGLTGNITPSSKIELNNIGEVLAVRSGEHPDKVRLVFDLHEQAGQLAWKQYDSSMIIRFFSNQNIVSHQGSEHLAAAELLNKNNNIVAVEQEPYLAAPVQDVRASQQQVSLSVFENHNASGQVCSHIEFVEIEGAKRAFIRLSLSEYPQFSLAKVSAVSYRLRIPNTNVASPELRQPFFPPHSFPGVVFVEMQQDRIDLIVLIGVERGTTLNAVAKDNTLLIEVME